MKKNAIIYCRVSTSKQSKNGESLQVQEKECREFCKRNDYQVVWSFSEQFTGTKDQRPKIQEALEFINNSELKIDYIVVLKIDRVSRWWIEIHNNFKKQFSDLWVVLRDVHWMIWESENVVQIEWVNTDWYGWAKNNWKGMIENITVMMSETERNTILQRMLWQAMRNNSKWYKVRNSDFWYSLKKVSTKFWTKKIQIDNPDESIFIKKMFELKARWDLSDKEIVAELNLIGFKSRERIKWNKEKTEAIWKLWWKKLSSEQLQRYIKSPIYAWIVCELWTWNKPLKAPYDGLVSIDLWNKANRWKYKINIVDEETIEIDYYKWETKLEEEPIIQKPKKYNSDYMFWKVLQCPECWWHMTAERSKSKSWKYHHYYSCRWKKWAKHKNYSLRRDEVNDEVVDIFAKLNFDKQWLEVINIITDNIYNNRKDDHIEKSNNIQKAIKELKIKEKTITKNAINLAPYKDLLKATNEELQEIKWEIKKLTIKQKERWERFWLERFKNSSNKILTHLDKLVLQKENPEIIQLAFDIVFGWKVEYEDLKSHTPLQENILALNTSKKAGQECNLNQPYALNRKWWIS